MWAETRLNVMRVGVVSVLLRAATSSVPSTGRFSDWVDWEWRAIVKESLKIAKIFSLDVQEDGVAITQGGNRFGGKWKKDE